MLKWNISETIDDTLKTKYPDMHPVILQLLANRGISSKPEIEAFLNPEYQDLHEPFLFRDMQKAVDRVKIAADENQSVFVYGDYDADGVTSSVLMVEALAACGIKSVSVYIPHREKEGYGLNRDAIEYMAEEGAKLIIAVDCGTSSVSEVAFARELGMDVIICDHHEEPAELPKDVVAFLNPHLEGETYPFKGLSGCGVVFKLTQALWKSFGLPEGHEKWFLDLAAISTVADMMDLVGENRIITAYGLKVLNKTKRKGLQVLMSDMRAGPHGVGTYEIGFVIAPRLNAAGRIDHANTAYELLKTDDQEEAKAIAHSLNATNGERQSQTARIVKEAKEQVASQLKGRKVLVAFGNGWSPGVVGLVSGRLTEEYYRPSLVITTSEKGIVGSGRSIPGFNITEALSHASQYLERFGGHDGACGFTVKSEDMIDDFANALNRIADEKFSDEDLVKSLGIDMELSLELVDWDFVRALEQMEPYGMANPMPKFVSRGVRVANVFLMGQNGEHMRVTLEQGGVTRSSVAFGFGKFFKGTLHQGDLIDIVYNADVNEWNGKKDIQLKIIDIKKA